MRTFFTLLFLTLFGAVNAQVSFEKGFLIKNDGSTLECLIKDKDWSNTPNQIQYKIDDDGDVKQAGLKELQSFGIGSYLKFIRFTGEVDVSSSDVARMSDTREPVFENDTLFLKVLLEGETNLYSHENGKTLRFFYKVADSELIKQLIYKKYKKSTTEVAENKAYIFQLTQLIVCDDISMNEIQNTSYTRVSLVQLFNKYAKCKNQDINQYALSNPENKGKNFNIHLRGGIDILSLDLDASLDGSGFESINFVEMGSKTLLRFGVEVELFLPFNRKKWSLILEPTFVQKYETQRVYIAGANTRTVKTSYSSFQLPIGVRHRFYLNDKLNIFLNGGILIDIPTKYSTEGLANLYNFFDIEGKLNFSPYFGIGTSIANRVSFEFRSTLKRNVIDGRDPYSTGFQSNSFVVGVRLK